MEGLGSALPWIFAEPEFSRQEKNCRGAKAARQFFVKGIEKAGKFVYNIYVSELCAKARKLRRLTKT